MSGNEDPRSQQLWSTLKSQTQELMQTLERGDLHSASTLIHEINATRDRSLYHEVGKLTRGLHDALRNFEIDTTRAGMHAENVSAMANAQDRLDYVINLTQQSADKTMDVVEAGLPMASEMGQQARDLQAQWSRLVRREMKPNEFRDLYHQVGEFLQVVSGNCDQFSEQFNTILLAQDFQDLTGQVIKRVMTLVQEVEERLVDLMRVAGHVEEITGIVRSVEEGVPALPHEGSNSVAEGPIVNPEQRDDVVSGQDDVDDLLSSLGF